MPWKSRTATVHAKTLSRIVLKDGGVVKLPSASFTRMVDGDTVELLADHDGPVFDNRRVRIGTIHAGQPWLTLRIVE
jgi:hypothetical protein